MKKNSEEILEQLLRVGDPAGQRLGVAAAEHERGFRHHRRGLRFRVVLRRQVMEERAGGRDDLVR